MLTEGFMSEYDRAKHHKYSNHRNSEYQVEVCGHMRNEYISQEKPEGKCENAKGSCDNAFQTQK
jgi:hypothetical protein